MPEAPALGQMTLVPGMVPAPVEHIQPRGNPVTVGQIQPLGLNFPMSNMHFPTLATKVPEGQVGSAVRRRTVLKIRRTVHALSLSACCICMRHLHAATGCCPSAPACYICFCMLHRHFAFAPACCTCIETSNCILHATIAC